MDEPNLIPTPLPGIPQASTRYAKVCFLKGSRNFVDIWAMRSLPIAPPWIVHVIKSVFLAKSCFADITVVAYPPIIDIH